MRVEPSPTQDLRITHWDKRDTFLIDMSWDDWDELVRDVAYFRQYGRSRPGSEQRITDGIDRDARVLWLPPGH